MFDFCLVDLFLLWTHYLREEAIRGRCIVLRTAWTAAQVGDGWISSLCKERSHICPVNKYKQSP